MIFRTTKKENEDHPRNPGHLFGAYPAAYANGVETSLFKG